MRSRIVPLLLAPLVWCVASDSRAEIVDRIDETAPDLSCTKWWGPDLSKMAKHAGRVVIVHFSRPEVVTSKGALAALERAVRPFEGKALTIIEVVVSSDEAKAATYVETTKPVWSVAFDGAGTTSERYPGGSVPRTYLIGPDGRIAWHAHPAALTSAMIEEQLARLAWFSPSADLKVGKPAVKAMAEMRYRAALDEAAKIDASPTATDTDRALAAAIRADLPRAYAQVRKRAETLVEDADYGIAWRRFERMTVCFKGTAHEKETTDRMAALNKREIVPFVVAGQNKLDEIAARPRRTKKQVEDSLLELDTLAYMQNTTIVGPRAEAVIAELQARLAEFPRK